MLHCYLAFRCLLEKLSISEVYYDYLIIIPHAAFGDVGGEVLLQDAPLGLGGFELHILLLED